MADVAVIKDTHIVRSSLPLPGTSKIIWEMRGD